MNRYLSPYKLYTFNIAGFERIMSKVYQFLKLASTLIADYFFGYGTVIHA